MAHRGHWSFGDGPAMYRRILKYRPRPPRIGLT